MHDLAISKPPKLAPSISRKRVGGVAHFTATSKTAPGMLVTARRKEEAQVLSWPTNSWSFNFITGSHFTFVLKHIFAKTFACNEISGDNLVYSMFLNFSALKTFSKDPVNICNNCP